jgi:hypothetical protein
LSSVKTTVTSSGGRMPWFQYRRTSLYMVQTCGIVVMSLPVTSARICRSLLMMLCISSMPLPSGRAVSPLPRMPSVTTPSAFSFTMRWIPAVQYFLIASELKRKLHSPVPP